MADEKTASSGAPPEKKPRRRPFFMKQKIMQRVLYALVPVALSGVYFFGWRVAALLLVCNVVGVATEYVTSRQRGQPVSQAVFVTLWLYGLSLPPTTPYWMAGVGAVVAVLFGKEVFGGFGRNFANPAIVGRAFVYVCFPKALTGSFVPAFRGFPGGFAEWSFLSLEKLPDYLAEAGNSVTDAVTSASPMWALRDFGYQASYWDLFTGSIGDTFQTEYGRKVLAAGSIGEACAPIIILGGIYLVVTKTANWRLMLGPFIGAAIAQLLLKGVGAPNVQPLLFKLLAGAFLYVCAYMVVEPISAPKLKGAMWIYGGLIGFLIIVLSWKGQFVAAASFSVILGNMFAPLMDMGVREWNRWRKQRGEKPKAPEGGEGEETAEPEEAGEPAEGGEAEEGGEGQEGETGGGGEGEEGGADAGEGGDS